ncbi:MAG: hypothetical protein ACON5N_05345 [Akkermansiaceae bacterium]
MKTLLALFLLTLLPSFAEKAHTPKTGIKERTDILNAIRDPLEDTLHQPLIFRVDHLKVQDNWAFLIGTPRTKDDKPVNYKGTRFEGEADLADELLVCLLRFKQNRWYVVTHGLFTNDVWWIGLDKEYKAPKGIFPALPTIEE